MKELTRLQVPTTRRSSRWGQFEWTRVQRLLPGLGLSALLALAATRLGTIGWLLSHGISALTAAIALGIVIGNTVYSRFAGTAGVGVTFSKQTLLRAGVVLYGLRLTLHDVGQVGCRFQYSLAKISTIHGHWTSKGRGRQPRTGDLASIFCSVPAKCRSARRAIHAPLKAMRRI